MLNKKTFYLILELPITLLNQERKVKTNLICTNLNYHLRMFREFISYDHTCINLIDLAFKISCIQFIFY